MKKPILLLMTVFFVNTLIAQNIKQGVITYTIAPIDIKYNDIDKELVAMFTKINFEKTNMRMELKFKGGESYFGDVKKEGSEIIDRNAYHILSNGAFGKHKFYTNKSEGVIIRQEQYDDGEDNIVYTSNFDKLTWTLTNETKIIGKYLCFKATTTKGFIRKGVFKQLPIEAWYCPEIPIQFGPFDYSNLPGLIMEVKEDLHSYTATYINLTTEITDIVRPTK